MKKSKDVHVKSGQHVVLSAETATALGIDLVDVRPKTPKALKTLMAQVDDGPARLHDEQNFERVKSRKGLVALAATKEGTIEGLTIGAFRAIVRALPSEPRMPQRIEVRREQRCSCSRSDARSMVPVGMASEIKVWKPVLPPWLQRLQVFVSALFIRDIVIERGGTLTIEHPTVAARNFVLHGGGRVVQRAPSLVIDLSGALRTPTVRTVRIRTAGVR